MTLPVPPTTPTIAVVGGGISGLAAAWRLTTAAPGARVLVLEQSSRPGGKLRLEQVGPAVLDVGAEALLARRPEAVDLLHEIGLGEAVVHPVTTGAQVLARGRLYPLPPGSVLGVPSDPAALAGILSPDEVARLAKEPGVAARPLAHDVAVRPWLTARLGAAVVDRMVEPLLGGVYAGHAAKLSLRATMPLLWEAGRAGRSLLEAVGEANRPSGVAAGPVFAGLRGGVGRLPEELAALLSRRGVMVGLGVAIRGLRRTEGGWRLVSGPAGREQTFQVDAVVLAVPPGAAARLLAADLPAAAAELAAVETASVAVVTVLLPREELAGVGGSGFLLPPMEGYAIKGVTFSAAKWAWSDQLDPGLVPVRMSLGRAGEEAVLQRDDADLVALAVADLGSVLGRALHPAANRVTRWGGALPQYAVGHVERVARIRAAVADVPGLAVCGAVMDGVGVPACIGAAYRAADDVAARLRQTVLPGAGS